MAERRGRVVTVSRVERTRLVRRGFLLEYTTLGWNVVGVFILAYAALAARSVALAGFGLDSLIEIGASVVVVWELSDAHGGRRGRALRLIAVAFVLLAVYLSIQATWVLVVGHRAGLDATLVLPRDEPAQHRPGGFCWVVEALRASRPGGDGWVVQTVGRARRRSRTPLQPDHACVGCGGGRGYGRRFLAGRGEEPAGCRGRSVVRAVTRPCPRGASSGWRGLRRTR
jgi:hypothetical protein